MAYPGIMLPTVDAATDRADQPSDTAARVFAGAADGDAQRLAATTDLETHLSGSTTAASADVAPSSAVVPAPSSGDAGSVADNPMDMIADLVKCSMLTKQRLTSALHLHLCEQNLD